MKKKYLIALSIIIALGALVWFREPLVKAAGGAFGLNTQYHSGSDTDGALTAGDLNYMSPGAGTTTVTAFTGGTDTLQVNVFGVASTVATTDLRFRIEYSNSTSSVPSEQLWFPEAQELNTAYGGFSAVGTTTVLTRNAKEYAFRPIATGPHRLATSTTMNSTFNQDLTFAFSVKIRDITARWTRVIFYIPTTGASQTLSTALDQFPTATSTNAGIYAHPVGKDPL